MGGAPSTTHDELVARAAVKLADVLEGGSLESIREWTAIYISLKLSA